MDVVWHSGGINLNILYRQIDIEKNNKFQNVKLLNSFDKPPVDGTLLNPRDPVYKFLSLLLDRTSCGSWISLITNGWPILLLLTKSAYGSIFRILYLIVSYNFKNCNISIIKRKKEKRFTESGYSSSSIEIGKKTNNNLNSWEVILLRDQERSLKMAPTVYNNGCDAA